MAVRLAVVMCCTIFTFILVDEKINVMKGDLFFRRFLIVRMAL